MRKDAHMDTRTPPSHQTLCGVEIFRAGSRISSDGRSIEFGQADLDEIVASFEQANPDGVPLVIGHPQTHDDAHGWVSRLWRDGNSLFCDCEGVSDELAAKISDRRLPNRSASFFPPHHPHNPTPGCWHLRHVGWLGAVAPAVPGLQPVQFSVRDGFAYADFRSFEDADSHQSHLVPASGTREAHTNPDLETNAMSNDTDQLAALHARIAQMESDLTAAVARADAEAARAADFSSQLDSLARAKTADNVEQLIRAGHIAPRDRAGLTAVFERLDGLSETTDFAAHDGQKRTLSAFLTELLSSHRVLDFGSHAVGAMDEPIRSDSELDARARQYAAEKNCDYASALTHCARWMQPQ